MRIDRVVLRLVEMPLKFRFRTSFGETTKKRFVLLEARSRGVSGWGECVAEDGPFYSPETTDSAWSVLSRFLVPLVLGQELGEAADVDRLAARVRGNRMAKGALETALRDLFARAGLDGKVRLPDELPGRGHTYHQFVVRVDRRDALREHLAKQGVGAEIYYPISLHEQQCFAGLGYRRGDFPESERAEAEVLALPIFPELMAAEIEYVADVIRRFYA